MYAICAESEFPHRTLAHLIAAQNSITQPKQLKEPTFTTARETGTKTTGQIYKV